MVIPMSIKTYSELITLPTFVERFRYLKLGGTVGEDTFGFERYLNQKFYQTIEWKNFRRKIIVRDYGCDLGVEGHEIHGSIYIHHLNPITIDDLRYRREEVLMNPENAICVSFETHNAIHYGDENILTIAPIERTKNDTCPWRHD
jgi:hypothetical protein